MNNQEGNELIREFVGKEFHDKLCYEEFGGIDYSECRGFYHSSWNWFMPVFDKVHKVLNEMRRPSANHVCMGDALEVDVHCAVMIVNIEKAFIAIVKFIKWYNQNKEV